MRPRRSALTVGVAPHRQSLIREALRDLGFLLVIEAATPREALEKLELLAIDALVVGGRLSEENLLAFIRDFRSRRSHNDRVPVAVDAALDVRQAQDAGASGLIDQAAPAAELVAQIERILRAEDGSIDPAASQDRRPPE
jgi:DNA-binding NarL/FixJ family response regulator